MPIAARRAYLEAIWLRYRNARKGAKKHILDEFCATCGYSRKHAIRILNRSISVRDKRPGPQPKYLEALPALKELWDLMGQTCSKKMRAALPMWLPFYKVSDRVAALLLKMSASTIDRLLKQHRARSRGKGLSTTRSSGWVKAKIPLKLLDGEVKVPGYMEMDTVAHCGNSNAGEYANSLTATDLFPGWTELRASWTKQSEGIVAAGKKIEDRLPFTLIGVASDNGSEFLNDDFYRWLTKREAPVNFVRRRPYKKNDNAHVEQKNWTHVRQLFGYERFDDQELIPIMNEIYQAYWCPLWNLFTPVMKLKSKERIGGKIRKYYDEPKTPAQRLLESPLVPYQDKSQIMGMLASRNPIDLKRRLDQRLKEFFELVDKKKGERRSAGS
jgi:hypothetical protein